MVSLICRGLVNRKLIELAPMTLCSRTLRVKHVECIECSVYAQARREPARMLDRSQGSLCAVMFLFILKSRVKRAGQLTRLVYPEGGRESGDRVKEPGEENRGRSKRRQSTAENEGLLSF